MENSNSVVSVSCHDCDVEGYIENIAQSEVSFCPKCGSKNITVIDNKKSLN